jgi:hypothetical protein
MVSALIHLTESLLQQVKTFLELDGTPVVVVVDGLAQTQVLLLEVKVEEVLVASQALQVLMVGLTLEAEVAVAAIVP